MYSNIIKLNSLPYENQNTPKPRDIFGPSFEEHLYTSDVLKRGQSESTLLKYHSIITEKLWNPLLDGASDRDEILDIGSGGAYHLLALNEELISKVCLMDLCGGMLEDAKSRFPEVNTIRRNWFDTQIPSNSIKKISGFNADTMISNDEEMERLLIECMRILAPGGRLVFLDIHAPDLSWAKVPGINDDLPGELYYHYSHEYRDLCIENFQSSQRSIIESLGGRVETYGVGYYDFNNVNYGEVQKPIINLIANKD